ncbi:ABC transporter permease [Crateriforma spongiae]|uniref:ABC transporter permease n=1 Tax=Crateriforma spongiae TaxID=2724528 RepID=UPI0014459C43|nr:FtsX-like permease family protein [Crateriforma spongiae]
MYRWLLCFRYLRTRYIALASIISVTLGVATLIVVNAVMSGFAAEMHERLHGLASDILLESWASGGLPNPEFHVDEIRKVVGDDLEGVSYSVHVPAMLGIDHNGQVITRHVQLVGIDPATYDKVSHFGRYLIHRDNRQSVSFQLRDGGYAESREGFPISGWSYRRRRAMEQQLLRQERERAEQIRQQFAVPDNAAFPTETSNADGDGSPIDEGLASGPSWMNGPSMQNAVPEELGGGESATEFDPANEQYAGIVLGISTCSTKWRDSDGNVHDTYFARPGDDIRMMFPSASDNPKVINQKFTVVDLYESGMSEYDSTFAFVPLDKLQDFRQMVDPQTNVRSVTTIQLKLRESANLNAVRDALRQRFPADVYSMNIQTWRDMQGPLLSAVQLETTILNILLFLIIAVAGFGILATFFMIVVEKTRDIGTLKALGASGGGVMSIFLSYGLLLGGVGSGVGLVGGLLFVRNINRIAELVEMATGQEVFDPTVYYFTEIPTIIDPITITWVMAGAIAIAVTASVLPALRAARMHPVAALRFE